MNDEERDFSNTQAFSRIRVDMEIVKKDISDVKVSLDRLTLAILGDGDGRPGIVRQMDAVKAAIGFNDPKGSIDERVSKLEAKIDDINGSLTSIKMAAWTFVVAFIIFFSSFIWSLMTHQISIHIP